MTEPVLVLTDIHGCYYTMIRLLNRAPKGVRLVLNGDLVDRGPSSREVIEFAINNAIPTVMGNHEDLCLAFYKRAAHCISYYDRDVWLYNGGESTLGNWATEGDIRGGRVPDEVLNWMEKLPAYLTPSDQLDSAGRKLLVSHTGYGLDADWGSSYGWFKALWGRYKHGDGPFVAVEGDENKEGDDGFFRVFGHTYNREAEMTDRYCNIDTGAAYKKYNHLTGLIWPTKELLVQPYDERPVAPTFKLDNGVLV